MNPTDEHLAELIGTELSARADRLPSAPATLASVRAGYTRRRRRRIATGVAAAAAALALAVPTGLNLRADDTPAPAAPVPEQPTRHAAILAEGLLTAPDGTTTEIGAEPPYGGFGVLSDSRILRSTENGVAGFASDGTQLFTEAGETNLVTFSPDGSAAVWTDDRGQLRVLRSGVPEPESLGTVPATHQNLWVQALVCEAQCTVYLGDAQDVVRVTDGIFTPVELPEPFQISDVSPDGTTWAVNLAPQENAQYGCAALYDVATAAVTTRNCDTWGLRFSPDGRHLLGGHFENAMSSELTVLDTDLTTVAAYRAQRRSGFAVGGVGWRDNETVLAAHGTWQGTWELQAYSLDDRPPVVLEGPVPGPNPEMASRWYVSD